MLLELAGEVLGIFEAEEVGGFGDGFAIMQVGGGSLHHEIADDGGGCLACCLTDEIAEVVGRKEQLLRTITDGGQTELALTSFAIIVSEQVIEALQLIVVDCNLRLELTLIESGTILQYQFEVSDDDAAQMLAVRPRAKLIANHLEADFYSALLVGRGMQRLVLVIREEMIVVDTPCEVCAVKQLR